MSVSTSVKAIIQFDLSALPSGVQASDIEKATLIFYVSSLSRAGKLTVSQITTPWTESALSYNTNLLFSGDPLLTPVIANSSSFVSVDITPLISGWVDDPLTNNGLILTPAPTYNTGLGIATKESSGRSAYIDVILKVLIFNYKIGDTGPGGGIIFFVDRYDEYPGFTYLEASPEPQPKSTWCDVNTAINIGAVGMAGSIGSGQVNTTNMVNACQSG
ncbi:MAG: DNRLRE domain-containing protein, partial [Methylococcaceae bacterium]